MKTEQRKTMILDQTQVQSKIHIPAGEHVRIVLPLVAAMQHGARMLDVVLDGEGADAEVFGVFCGSEKDTMQLTVNTMHAARNTRSFVRVGAVLGGSASFHFSGMIKIAPGAHGSNGELHQHSLLLSDDARAQAVPALEIEANDVKAFHAATAGPLDPAHLFFLMSRGLPQQRAAEYIVRGFVAPVLRMMPQTEHGALEQQLQRLFASSWTQRI